MSAQNQTGLLATEPRVLPEKLLPAQRLKDGYVNATELCRVYEMQTGTKKTPYHWFETNRANRFIELVSRETGIPVSPACPMLLLVR